MGTGKSGRYLNTRGSNVSISDFTLVHASEGRFRKQSDGSLLVISGCHGEDGITLLKKYSIPYKIEKTYKNGVRVGSILTHNTVYKRQGGQVWFPKNWTNADIRKAGLSVAKMSKNRFSKDGEHVYGYYKGVRVGIIRNKGQVATIFPDIKQEE